MVDGGHFCCRPTRRVHSPFPFPAPCPYFSQVELMPPNFMMALNLDIAAEVGALTHFLYRGSVGRGRV